MAAAAQDPLQRAHTPLPLDITRYEVQPLSLPSVPFSTLPETRVGSVRGSRRVVRIRAASGLCWFVEPQTPQAETESAQICERADVLRYRNTSDTHPRGSWTRHGMDHGHGVVSIKVATSGGAAFLGFAPASCSTAFNIMRTGQGQSACIAGGRSIELMFDESTEYVRNRTAAGVAR